MPGLRGKVPRWTQLHYEGFDRFGARISRDVDGFHARLVQHECVHLNSFLYPIRIKDFPRFGYTKILFSELGRNHDD